MTISNILSISRIILVIPAALLFWYGHETAGIIIGGIAGVTDFFDGWLARKLNQESELGKILDPVADKFYLLVVVILLVLMDYIPLWFVIAAIARDVIILAAGWYARKKTNFVLPSTFEGKATYFLIMATILAIVLGFEEARIYGLPLCVAAMAYTLIIYGVRLKQHLDGN